jgi:hypothetical protein
MVMLALVEMTSVRKAPWRVVHRAKSSTIKFVTEWIFGCVGSDRHGQRAVNLV